MDTETTTRDQSAAGPSCPTISSLNINNVNINEPPGVTLSPHEKLLLYEGNPTLKHLSLWSPRATFSDPMGIMVGYSEYAAGWYGIPALCRDTQIQSHAVISAGNPIKLDLSNKYVVKGINKELTIDSAVRIYIDKDGKIDEVEDRWVANVPEQPTQELQTYSVGRILAWGWQRGKDWMWWVVCTPTWWWTLWPVRRLNGTLIPLYIKPPKSEGEDVHMGARRGGKKKLS
ncbi:hypothetical protein EDB81DRAFT_754020 [Dactylonectria macrodidyma]|uniref:Uncharacterized protein n=1 Tax=Dactylonectria macrodidyma TaxID=307937 RepID=A0A9P9FJY1_9HYPO|nr:hypothetical protein EDB81DRAFT_754020 [Dactylonectria macrodidyma]